MNTGLKREFFRCVIPSLLAFALSGVYAIVDGFFIGRTLGDIGLAASGLSYPVCAFIQAVGTGIGLAGAIHFAVLRAQDRQREADECISSVIVLMLAVSAVLTAVFRVWCEPLMRLLGARGETLVLCTQYAGAIAMGTVFQVAATSLVPFIRNLGGTSFSMLSMMLGFFTNIVLDYAFVWLFHWGMAGAAWATVIGQAITTLAAVGFLLRHRQTFVLPAAGQMLRLWRDVLRLAVSPFGLTFSQTVTLLLMNRFLLLHGDEQAVAVYGCIDYVLSVIYLLLQGVGDGCQPLISDYYGGGRVQDAKAVRRTAYFTAFVIAGVCMAGVFAARYKIGVLFGATALTNADVGRLLPYFLAPMLCLSATRVTTSYFYATERALLSYLLVYAEPLCTLVLLLLLPFFFGLGGVWAAVPAAQCITFVFAMAGKLRVDRRE